MLFMNMPSIQWMEDGLNLKNGVPVMRYAAEDLRSESEPALDQFLSTVVQSVWDNLMRHDRVMKTLVQVYPGFECLLELCCTTYCICGAFLLGSL